MISHIDKPFKSLGSSGVFGHAISNRQCAKQVKSLGFFCFFGFAASSWAWQKVRPKGGQINQRNQRSLSAEIDVINCMTNETKETYAFTQLAMFEIMLISKPFETLGFFGRVGQAIGKTA